MASFSAHVRSGNVPGRYFARQHESPIFILYDGQMKQKLDLDLTFSTTFDWVIPGGRNFDRSANPEAWEPISFRR